jgi:diguanylate cyclase (GGDEF)-like protein
MKHDIAKISDRKLIHEALEEELARYNRYKQPFSLIMLDVDNFKIFTDSFGHVAGDNLLKKVAKAIEQSIRAVDKAARCGADEFVAIYPHTSKVDAMQLTNRLKEKITMSFDKSDKEMPVTVSIGFATVPDDASSITELFEKTDQALYLAKKGGGNRVVHL